MYNGILVLHIGLRDMKHGKGTLPTMVNVKGETKFSIKNKIFSGKNIPLEDSQFSPNVSPNQLDDKSGRQFHCGEDQRQKKEEFSALGQLSS